MFSALDHLNGIQLLLVLSPIVLIMSFIRKREEAANAISFKSMNTVQQGWIFLSLLAPGLNARLLTLMDDEERERVLKAGSNLQGNAGKVAVQVLDTFFRSVSTEGKGIPSKDVDEVCHFLNLKYENDAKTLLKEYRKAYL